MVTGILRIAGLLVAGVIASASSTTLAQQPQKISYLVSGAAIYYTLQYVAEDQGYFKKENIAPDLVLMPSGARIVAGLLGGSADVGTTNFATTIQANEKGGDLVVIAPLYDIFPQGILLSNDAIKRSGITPDMSTDEKVKRLKGLKIGISTPGSGSDQLVRTLLITRGYNPDKEVELQPLGQGDAMLAALEKGLVDGFSFTLPFPQVAEARGLGKTVIDPFLGQVPEMQGGTALVLAVSRSTLEKNRAKLLSFVRAHTWAMKFVQEHPDDARRITRKHFPQMDEKLFDAMFAVGIRGIPKSPVISEQQFDKTIHAINITAKSPVKGTFTETIVNDMAQQAAKDILSH